MCSIPNPWVQNSGVRMAWQATRYPKGAAVLLTALGRTSPTRYTEPQAHVNLTVPAPEDAGDSSAGTNLPT